VFLVFNMVWYMKYSYLAFGPALSVYLREGLIYDIIACSPFVIALDTVVDPIALIVIIRLFRICAMARMTSLFEKIEILYLDLVNPLGLCKIVLFLFYLWHYASCVWYFVNIICEPEEDFKWVDLHGLKSQGLDV
jgi:hypothetical protein